MNRTFVQRDPMVVGFLGKGLMNTYSGMNFCVSDAGEDFGDGHVDKATTAVEDGVNIIRILKAKVGDYDYEMVLRQAKPESNEFRGTFNYLKSQTNYEVVFRLFTDPDETAPSFVLVGEYKEAGVTGRWVIELEQETCVTAGGSIHMGGRE